MATEIPPVKTALSYLRANYAAIGSNDAANWRIERQRQACQQLAEQVGVTIVGEYVEHRGAVSIGKRPLLQELLDRVLHEKPTYLITTDLARLVRHANDSARLFELLARAGTKLLTTEGNKLTDIDMQIRRMMANSDR